ncbi:MAG: toll/interleukin-1 receptor domain-containing protein [Haliscomenobacteraceae bacterium CHB4]|nr:hypothetical protein [Saprospiraceae bacterium]MCE7923648.1 toll/interleukin-1 receptor domain-containing protein [Haliscomenobacteraceae bacterium CHB4]
MPNPSIFISYRIDDSLTQAGRLHDFLEKHFGEGSVFWDKDKLKPGMRWPKELTAKVKSAKIVLVLYANRTKWLGGQEVGLSRMDDRNDWVRKEVEIALRYAKGKLIIPVLINNAQLPSKEELPGNILHKLHGFQECRIRESHWLTDIQPLLRQIEKVISSKVETLIPQSSSLIHFDKKNPTEFDFYCCNRDEHFGPVIQFLYERRSESQLHVFLPSHPHDSPASFVTRVSYHLFPNNNFASPSKRHGERTCTMKLVETPLEHKFKALEDIQRDISTYSQPNYSENIVLFYRIELKKWDLGGCQELIRNIVANMLPSIPGKKLRFFYWLDPTGCQANPGLLKTLLRKNTNRLELMKAACQGNDQIRFLEPLQPVQQTDLHTWFSHLCSYPIAYESKVASIFGEKNVLPMANIEWHLLPLFQEANRYR